MKNKSNIAGVVQSLVHYYKIPVNKNTIERYIKNHYLYPSVEVVCDAFEKWKIDYEIYQLHKNEIQNIDSPFIALIHNNESRLVFVYNISGGDVIYSDLYKEKKRQSLNKFLKDFSGLVIQVKPDNRSGESDYKQKKQSKIISKLLIPVSLFIILLGALPFIKNNIQSGNIFRGPVGVLTLTKCIGILVSVFIVLKELQVYNRISYKLCTVSSKVNCNAVLNTPASVLYGWVSWGDIGFIYFLSGLFILFITPHSIALNLLLAVSVFSIPFPFYSIYYQFVKMKKICPFCILAQIMLIIEFFILVANQKIKAPLLNEVWIVGIVFAFIGLIALLIKVFYFHRKKIEAANDELLFIKNNPNVFYTILKQKIKIDIPINEDSFFCGNPDSSIIITIFLSLSCSECARAFIHLKELFYSNREISLNLVFSVTKKDELDIINNLYYRLENEEADKVLDILGEWYNQALTKKEWFGKYYIQNSYNKMDKFKEVNNTLYKQNNINTIPAVFINGYKLPEIYQATDLNSLLLENITESSA